MNSLFSAAAHVETRVAGAALRHISIAAENTTRPRCCKRTKPSRQAGCLKIAAPKLFHVPIVLGVLVGMKQGDTIQRCFEGFPFLKNGFERLSTNVGRDIAR